MNVSRFPMGCYLTRDGVGSGFYGKARDVTGLFTSLGGGLRRVKLSGITPRGRLLDCAGRVGTKRALAGNADIVLLDVNDVEVGSYFVADVSVEEVRARYGDAEIMDLVVTLDCEDLLPDAEKTWELIRSGELNHLEMWRSLDAVGRYAWLSVALNHHGYRSLAEAQPGAVYELDGRYVTDENVWGNPLMGQVVILVGISPLWMTVCVVAGAHRLRSR